MQKIIELSNAQEATKLLGVYDKNIRLIKKLTGAQITFRNNQLKITGKEEAVEKAYHAITKLRESASALGQITTEDIEFLLKEREPTPKRYSIFPGVIFRRNIKVEPKSKGQAFYLEQIEKNDMVFCIGPSGTGKTFLAVAMAIEAIQNQTVRKLVLVRPAIEAGEKLGYLPGDIYAKVSPYLRPIYDALNYFLEYGQLQRLVDADIIEIAPLAYMRGRTLDEAYIILDEAQNTTSDQMKMFLTRMGNFSKVVITGDITQIDLPKGKISGLVEAQSLFKGLPGISFVYLTKEDTVRHPLVQRIIEVYERRTKQK
jgi:phosphate starvation-inducible PhoH-like protein